MQNILTGSLLMVDLLLGTATASFASQQVHVREARATTHEVGNVHRADYYYHLHRYHHRTWDRTHHCWRYW